MHFVNSEPRLLVTIKPITMSPASWFKYRQIAYDTQHVAVRTRHDILTPDTNTRTHVTYTCCAVRSITIITSLHPFVTTAACPVTWHRSACLQMLANFSPVAPFPVTSEVIVLRAVQYRHVYRRFGHFAASSSKYRVIRNDCRGSNNLSYTIHFR